MERKGAEDEKTLKVGIQVLHQVSRDLSQIELQARDYEDEIYDLKAKLQKADDKIAELNKYDNAAYLFLEAEALSKILRYGSEYYKENYSEVDDKDIKKLTKLKLEEQVKFLL